MNSTEFHLISIPQLRQSIGLPVEQGEDFIIVSSHESAKNLEPFKHPCRLDACVFAICTGGTQKVTIDLKEYRVSENMMIVTAPRNIIQFDDIDPGFEGHFIVVSSDFMREIHIDLKNMLPAMIRIRNYPCLPLPAEKIDFLHRFYLLTEECIRNTEGIYRREITRNLISALVYKLFVIYHDRLSGLEEPAPSRREFFFVQFMELLSLHHREERSVGFYADKMHITPKYLSTLIKGISGKSAAEWIDEYVILEAKTLLRYSGLSIQEIAYQLNFSTQSFFGKYFKHHTGISPSQYKQQ